MPRAYHTAKKTANFIFQSHIRELNAVSGMTRFTKEKLFTPTLERAGFSSVSMWRLIFGQPLDEFAAQSGHGGDEAQQD
jgi:hypothetical protein